MTGVIGPGKLEDTVQTCIQGGRVAGLAAVATHEQTKERTKRGQNLRAKS